GARVLYVGEVRGRAPSSAPAGHLLPRAGEGILGYARRLAMAAPRSPGDLTVVMPAFSMAANLPSAVPEPPEAMAPAWPMRLPLGAEAPAMKPTTGLVTYSATNAAASSSAPPPISP